MNNQEFSIEEISIGYHPAGYRIDKTANVMNRYTKWEITDIDQWCNPQAVCFHCLPEQGWLKVDSFDWSNVRL